MAREDNNIRPTALSLFMNKKKKGLFERLLEFQTKPLRILARETAKGIREGLKDTPPNEKKEKTA